MRAKNKFTAFNTKKVDVSSLNQETCDSLIQSRIFINELLDKECLSRFNNLKRISRGLGFNQFLVKRRDGEKTHEFESTADLHALAESYGQNFDSVSATTRDGRTNISPN